MHRAAPALVALTLTAVLPLAATAPSPAQPSVAAAAVPEDLAPAELLVRLDGPRLHAGAPRWTRVDVAPDEDLATALGRLAASPGVAEVAFNHRYTLHDVPNDEYFADFQWNLVQVGWTDVWTELGDGTGATVAVLDSGVGTGGADLACHAFVHPYNAATGEMGLAAAMDTDGHGTHVMGTVGQCTNNVVGVAGVAPGATLMPVKVADAVGIIDSYSVAAGIAWAVSHGADVINLSLGRDCLATWPSCGDSVIDAQIAAAEDAGVVVVASAGNEGAGFVTSPANHPAAIAVGASTIAQTRADYSNHGSDLDLLAPGGDDTDPVWQETFNCPDAAYVICGFTGTSMAAPHVSAAAAIMRGLVPEATPAEIRTALAASALDLGAAGRDDDTGFGVLQIDGAIAALQSAKGLVDPCPAGASCDTVYTVDGGGRWRQWQHLTASSAVSSFYFGNPGDVAFSGDWDCDGDATPGLYRQSDGFVYLRNSATQGVADTEFFFGNPGDVPVAGDFDGDGCDTVSIYRPSQGRFFIVNQLGADGGGLGAAEVDYYFGNPGDKPFTGDFDGDGIVTVGLHRESTGLVYFRNSHTTGVADAQFVYGDPGDVVLAGDWDGDGDDTVAVYRPGNGHLYVKLANGAGNADIDLDLGSADQAARSQA